MANSLPQKDLEAFGRRRLSLSSELLLALAPTLTVLIVLAFIQSMAEQRLLFASLSSSCFLIYLDPQHGTNSAKTLITAQLGAACIGFAAYSFLGEGYLSCGCAMIITILAMILLDRVHPPAIATSMSFALRASNTDNLLLFSIAVGMTAVLVVLAKVAVRMIVRLSAGNKYR